MGCGGEFFIQDAVAFRLELLDEEGCQNKHQN